MLQKLKKTLEQIFDDYMVEYRAAGTRREYAGNWALDTKREVRKKMLLDVGAVIELARIHGIGMKKLDISSTMEKDVRKAQKDDDENNPLGNIDLESGTVD